MVFALCLLSFNPLTTNLPTAPASSPIMWEEARRTERGLVLLFSWLQNNIRDPYLCIILCLVTHTE